MSKINIDIKIIILLTLLLIIVGIPVYAHHGHFLYDNGREAYYPMQILAGKVLYKDIFNLYGPFSYLYNALLYKIFGIHLNVLYLSGYFSAFIIICFTYLISKEFLSRFLSFAISFFTLLIGVVNFSLFNFIFPYSYGMVYGLVAFMVSFYFLLKYSKHTDKTFFLYLGAFFAGICISNKYEFWAYGLVVLYSMFKFKRLSLKEFLLTCLSIFFTPLLCFSVLVYQGVSFADFLTTAYLMKKTIASASLKYFCKTHGVFVSKQAILSMLKNFAIVSISSLFFVFAVNMYNEESKIKKFLSFLVAFLSLIPVVVFATPELLIFIPMFIIFLFVFNIKKVFANQPLFLLVIAAITLSLKNLWGIIPLTYGLFYISFLILCSLALFFNIFIKLKNKQNIFAVFFLILTFILCYVDLVFTTSGFQTKNYSLENSRGEFYVDEAGCNIISGLFQYIENNSKKTDRIVVLPEGTFVNFFTNRPSDDFYNLLTPVAFDVYGEQWIINHFNQNKPEFFIIHDNPMANDYYYNNICVDYAVGFCNFISQNYTFEKRIGGSNFNFFIFKRVDN